jgi:hypothetical protein
MDASSGDPEAFPAAQNWRPAFPVMIALIVLLLSLLYAITFSQMVHHSLMEQFIAPDPNPPRYAGHTHYHNAAEWFLLVVPAIVGWMGTAASLVYLTRRWTAK